MPCSSAEEALYFPLSKSFWIARSSPSLANAIKSSSIGSGVGSFPSFFASSAPFTLPLEAAMVESCWLEEAADVALEVEPDISGADMIFTGCLA